jgi:hypothetical protein
MNRNLTLLMILCSSAIGCSQTSTTTQPSALPSASNLSSAAAAGTNGALTPKGSANGVAGSMPAYYDAQLFTINFKELPPGGEEANLAHNGSINTIYMSDGCMPNGQMFVSVLDAIQGDGFNPLWHETQVVFNKSAPCQQFTSDNAILAAAAANTITLQPTNELYRCAVIGKK